MVVECSALCSCDWFYMMLVYWILCVLSSIGLFLLDSGTRKNFSFFNCEDYIYLHKTILSLVNTLCSFIAHWVLHKLGQPTRMTPSRLRVFSVCVSWLLNQQANNRRTHAGLLFLKSQVISLIHLYNLPTQKVF